MVHKCNLYTALICVAPKKSQFALSISCLYVSLTRSFFCTSLSLLFLCVSNLIRGIIVHILFLASGSRVGWKKQRQQFIFSRHLRCDFLVSLHLSTEQTTENGLWCRVCLYNHEYCNEYCIERRTLPRLFHFTRNNSFARMMIILL